jgi:endonuclease G
MNRAQWRLVTWLLLILLVAFALWYFSVLPTAPPPPRPPPQPPPAPGSGPDSYAHLRWGNPSGAREGLVDPNNYLMKKTYFALSYNNAKGTPNWVSWRVEKEDLGNAPRVPFTADPDLPAGFNRVTNADYDDSGFDRGHMCPHGDRQSDAEASKATFVMTNVVPQSAANNEHGWERFESYCRSLVRQGKELYVVAGPQGQGGESRKGRRDVIHGKAGDIVVPETTWKVVMVLDAGGAPGPDTRLLAVVMPNDQTVGDDWRKYQTKVAEVEKLTGFTFFDKADPAIIGPLKGRVDAGP